MTSLPALIATGGVQTAGSPQTLDKRPSPRSRGIRQGLFIFLLTFVIAPIVGLISQFGLGIEPWPVGVVIFGLGFGGLLRIAYAMMFESKTALLDEHMQNAQLMGRPAFDSHADQPALPGQNARSQFSEPTVGAWLETNDLHPPSVTDSTTKLLEKDRDPG